MSRVAQPRRSSRRPRVPEFHSGQILNWRGWAHWGGTDLPCRYCGLPTPLLDTKKSPAHKVCAEQALTLQYAEAVAEYRKGQL